MSSLVLFLEHNPVARDSFSCSQSKQAVSLYHSNYGVRLDKTGLVLNGGQIPLVKTRFYRYICQEEHPYGENAMVAIMSYTGYNTEDAILINKSSLDRGMFNTSYFKTYEEEETTSMNSDGRLAFEGGNNTDENGLVPVNTKVTKETILMRMVQQGKVKNIYPNADQIGRVDKTFISEGEPGHRVAKVRICTERIPEIGDKFASRAGQKGTCGLILNEEDMPFTASGMRPDLIINPHASPSRMTLGQLIECMMGKIHLENGGKSLK
jgi:DNA-directed RNA polymerase beta subunit